MKKKEIDLNNRIYAQQLLKEREKKFESKKMMTPAFSADFYIEENISKGKYDETIFR